LPAVVSVDGGEDGFDVLRGVGVAEAARLRAIVNAVRTGIPWRISACTASRSSSRVIGGYRGFGLRP
jgi:hypothetical protein